MTEPNLDEDGSKSSFQKTVSELLTSSPRIWFNQCSKSAFLFIWVFRIKVVLRDWWLIKCPKEFEGKQFGVAGFEESVE